MNTAPGISSSSKIALNHLQVGLWHWDLLTDVVTGDIVLAHMVGIDRETIERGVRLGEVEKKIHPDDLHTYRRVRRHALDGDHAFVHVHRTVPGPGTVKWLLVRGLFDRDEAGRPTAGRGIVVDLTDEPGFAHRSGAGWVAAQAAEELPPIDRIAISVMGARQEIIALSEAQRNRLLPHIDGLLGQIGKEIATHSVDAVTPRPEGSRSR